MSTLQNELIVEVLTIANVLNLDLSKYKNVTDNSEFIKSITKDINDKLLASKNRTPYAFGDDK